MNIDLLTKSFPWARFSKKLAYKILKPRSAGVFCFEDTQSCEMTLVESQEGSVADGHCVHLYWMVDPKDGVIADAVYQVFGPSILIGACEVACETLLGKNYDQAKHLNVYLLDKQVRDRDDVPAFPDEFNAHVNLVIAAIQKASDKCAGIPTAENYLAPPVPTGMGEIKGDGYPGWIDLPMAKKLAVIEKVMDEDLRPYIEMDGGGVEILNLIDNREVIIAYKGNCTGCHSSIGATLSYIQQMLRAKVHPALVVVPDLQHGDLPY